MISQSQNLKCTTHTNPQLTVTLFTTQNPEVLHLSKFPSMSLLARNSLHSPIKQRRDKQEQQRGYKEGIPWREEEVRSAVADESDGVANPAPEIGSRRLCAACTRRHHGHCGPSLGNKVAWMLTRPQQRISPPATKVGLPFSLGTQIQNITYSRIRVVEVHYKCRSSSAVTEF